MTPSYAELWCKKNPVNPTTIRLLMEEMYNQGYAEGCKTSVARLLNGNKFELVDRGLGDGSVMLVPPTGTVYTNNGKVVSLATTGEERFW
jgi:hypothetical protein